MFGDVTFRGKVARRVVAWSDSQPKEKCLNNRSYTENDPANITDSSKGPIDCCIFVEAAPVRSLHRTHERLKHIVNVSGSANDRKK